MQKYKWHHLVGHPYNLFWNPFEQYYIRANMSMDLIIHLTLGILETIQVHLKLDLNRPFGEQHLGTLFSHIGELGSKTKGTVYPPKRCKIFGQVLLLKTLKYIRKPQLLQIWQLKNNFVDILGIWEFCQCSDTQTRVILPLQCKKESRASQHHYVRFI